MEYIIQSFVTFLTCLERRIEAQERRMEHLEEVPAIKTRYRLVERELYEEARQDATCEQARAMTAESALFVARSERAVLAQQVKQLEEDKKRLDWLEGQGTSFSWRRSDLRTHYFERDGDYRSVRECLDAARREPKG